MSVRVPSECFIDAAKQHLSSGKRGKGLPFSKCCSLAAQVQAVDLGLKPALLYDLNSAGPAQIQAYLHHLQESGCVSTALHLVALDHSVLIVNLKRSIRQLEELLQQKMVVVMDVSVDRACPVTVDMETSGVEGGVQDLLGSLRKTWKSLELDRPLVCHVDTQPHMGYNLCSLFGILLGYPAVYWFDSSRSNENCLGMTPLQVMRVTACWKAVTRGTDFCLYSFSIPEELLSETQCAVDDWTRSLRAQFSRQAAFSGLSISTETLRLPCVAL